MKPTVSASITFDLPGSVEAADGRVERREGSVGGLDAGVGQRVHQGRFAGVGVADERDGRVGHFEPALALDRARALDVAQAHAQARQPFAHAAAVNFELGFAGSARADTSAAGAGAAGLARQMAPLAGETRLQIAQLRDFDLQFALERARALREDIENQLAAIDNAELELVFEIARLRGAERVVEDRERRAAFVGEFADLGGLAASDEGARVDVFELLLDLAGDFGAGACGQRAEFGERIVAGDTDGRSQFNTDQDGAFGVVERWRMRKTQRQISC